ncbi:MAG TPA: hypothetical protein PKB14_22580 [Rubrivivax sp.]|nr:hypothetical protein [Rubrivivax sp.]
MSGRGKASATLKLIEACHGILAEIQPASVRAVCYRLFTMGLIPDMSKGSTNKVSTQLVWAREHGHIPWEWIVDETRAPERASQWSTPDEIINAAVRGYRMDYWQDQPLVVEVWSEKGTVRGTLAPVLDELGLTFRVMHGFASATTVNDIAGMSINTDKPVVALYVGDFDPSGMFMSEVDLPERIERYGGEVDLVRVALEKTDCYGLPSFDVSTKSGDKRHDWFVKEHGNTCWELDAMSPVSLRERVRAVVEELLDRDAWNHAIKIENAQIDSLQAFHKSWQASKYSAGGAA